MNVKVSIVWSTRQGDVELASTIDPQTLCAAKHSVLRLAEHKVAANIGDEVRELRARLEYEMLKQLLDYVLPEESQWRFRQQNVQAIGGQQAEEVAQCVSPK